MKIIFVVFLSLLLCGFNHGTTVTPAVVCTVTISAPCNGNTAATCNGIVNDSAAFVAFNSAQQGASGLVELVIPAGKTCCFLQGGLGIDIAKGIPYVRFYGPGATLTDTCNATTGGGFFAGAMGHVSVNSSTAQALAQTVSAGATSITLVTAGDTSKFTVGNYAVMVGFDLQGGGDPINPAFHDYVIVAAKDGGCNGTGTICFDRPLSNSYKSTWPQYTIGYGGPATLFVLDPTFNGAVEYVGLTMSQVGQWSAQGRSTKFYGTTFTGVGNICPFATVTMEYEYNNVVGTCIHEFDKMVDYVAINQSHLHAFDFQSASINNLSISNSTFDASGHTNGTAVVSNIYNSTFGAGLILGAFAYGTSVSVHMVNVTGTLTDANYGEASVDSTWTMSGGVMSKPLATIQAGLGSVPWATPGRPAYFTGGTCGSTPVACPFTITDVGISGSNVTVTLSCASCAGGAFPSSGLAIHVAPVVRN